MSSTPHELGAPMTVLTPESALDQLADALAARLNRRAADGGWLDTKAAAIYAGCTVTALHKAMASRSIEFRQDRPGGKAWFKREWLDAWRGL